VASFAGLSIDKSGTFRLVASAAGLSDGFSSFFNINPGAATVLEFTVPPSNAQVNQPIVPEIHLTARDALGNVVTTYAGPVSLTITSGTGTGGAALSGGGPVAPVNGVATFTAASINAVGTLYSLDASGSGGLTATSRTFDITALVGGHLQFTTPPSVTVAGRRSPGGPGHDARRVRQPGPDVHRRGDGGAQGRFRLPNGVLSARRP
jgi:hypothetical protein